jgi:hypothetical protein
MTKLIVVDLDKFYNFCIDNFFIWNHFDILNFNIILPLKENKC